MVFFPRAILGLFAAFLVHFGFAISPEVRLVSNIASKTSKPQVFPHRTEYRSLHHENLERLQQEDDYNEPKSYVIYDEHPYRIFKEWKPANLRREANPFGERQQAEVISEYPFSNQGLAYQSVYSNVLRVFDRAIGPNEQKIGFPGYGHAFPVNRGTIYPLGNPRVPENFPQMFYPNRNFHFPKFTPNDPNFILKHEFPAFFSGNPYDGNDENDDDAPETNAKPRKRLVLCSFIRLNEKRFPEDGGNCGRSGEYSQILPADYPKYPNLPDEHLPMEHRRQQPQMRRIKRSQSNDSAEAKDKRSAGYGYGYDNMGSPFGYNSGFNSYFSDFYQNRNSRDSYGGSRYNNYNRNRNQGNRYGNDFYDEYQNGDNSNSRGLTSYLTSGGRRYKNRQNNDNDNNNYNNDNDDYENDDNNNSNNNNDSYDDDEDRQNNRRGSNNRNNNNNNNNQRDRRRNNNNNNYYDNDYDDNYNRNNNNRYNNNNNNRRNNNRRNNNRRNNNRNRNNGYGNNNGYNNYNSYGNNGYGSYGNSGYGNYGNSGYGSNRYGGSGYGSSGYGNSYGSNNNNGGGYGYNSGFSYGGYY